MNESMCGDFLNPTPEQQIIVLIDAATLRKAEQLIMSRHPKKRINRRKAIIEPTDRP
jgi:hypothetical protein